MFLSEKELIESYRANAPDAFVTPAGNDIFFCPHCTHDF